MVNWLQNVCILPRRRQSELRSVCASLENLIPLAVVIASSATREVKLQTVTTGSASLCCCGSHRQWYIGCEWTPSGGDNYAFHDPFEGRVLTTITVRVELWAVLGICNIGFAFAVLCSPLSVLEARLSKSVPYGGGQCSCVFTRCRMSVVIAFCASFFFFFY